MAQTVLAYGDSLTWGSDPVVAGARHPASHRWPDVLAAGLGAGFRVIADGLRGRTTAYDEWLADCDRNGARWLPTALYTHAPVDLVVLLLGANDMKPHICGTALGAKQGMRRLVQIARNHTQGLTPAKTPKIIIVSPPPLVESDDAEMAAMFAGGIAESHLLAGHYADLARELDCTFFDAGTVAKAHRADGVHLDAQNTRAIGAALSPIVRSALNI